MTNRARKTKLNLKSQSTRKSALFKDEAHDPKCRALKQCQRSCKFTQSKLLPVMAHFYVPPVSAEATAAFCGRSNSLMLKYGNTISAVTGAVF